MEIAFTDLKEIYKELVADVESAKKLDTDFCSENFIKRTYTRSFFAMIEGIIFQFKKIALQTSSDSNIFKPYEVELLREKTAHLQSNGTAKERKAKIQLIPNIIFSFNSFAKAFSLNHKINKEGKGYQAMLEAVKIRDRITHPKSIECTQITDKELILLGDANKWFSDEVVKLLGVSK